MSLLVAGSLTAERLPIQTFDASRGLAGDKVWDLELDSVGALWIATATGVSRFDGARFRNFDVRHGLPHANVAQLLRLADGRLAAGTGAGVALLDPIGGVGERPWRALPAPAERGGGQLIALAEDSAGTLWAGGIAGLFRLADGPDGERLEAVGLPAGETGVRHLTAAGERLWLQLGRGIYRRGAGGDWRGPWRLPQTLDDPAGVTALDVDSAGRLWVASRRALCGLVPPDPLPPAEGPLVAAVEVAPLAAARVSLAAGSGTCVEVAGGLPATRTWRRIDRSPRRTLLVTGAAGLVEVDGERLTLRLDRPLATGASLQTALETPDGALWLGTGEQGLVRQLRSGIERIGDDDPLPGTLSTLLAGDDRLMVVLDYLDTSRRLLRLVNERWRDVTPRGARNLTASWGWGAISTLGADGSWWAGVSGGLAHFPPAAGGFAAASELPVPVAGALAGAEPIRLATTRDGALWVAAYAPQALWRIEPPGSTVRAYPEVASFPLGAPSAFAEDGDGTLWLGCYRGGLARRRANGGPQAGFAWLEEASTLVRGFVHALRFDHRGQLWVGAGGGLVVCRTPRAEDPGCERAQPGGELDHLQVSCLAEDGRGRLLAGTTKGLFVLDPASGRVDVLTTADGLPGNNIAALEPAGGGQVWVATEHALSRYTPPPPAPAPGPVRLVAVSVAGRALPLPVGGATTLSAIRLAPAERLVEIEAASIHLAASPPPAYQWQLGEGAWSPPATERRIRLAGLARGTVRVAVRAVSATGRVGDHPAVVELQVLPPLWRRGWFLVAVAALAVALAAVAYRLRVAQLLALERVRTHIAADLHDDLGSSLSRISILAEVARRQSTQSPDAAATLDTIGSSARELAEMASDIVWAIDPQRDDLASWVARLRRFGEDLFAPLGVGFAIDAPADAASVRLPAATRRDLYLLAKEALNNAAKYAGAGRVTVAVTHRAGRLTVTLDDDGVGITPTAEEAARARGGGHGLRSMRERAARLGARLEIAARPGGGTRIGLDIAL